MNYKIKKGLLTIGYHKLQDLLRQHKHVDLTKEQTKLVDFWKNGEVNENSSFFQIKDDAGQTFYEIHNTKEMWYITIVSDYKYAQMDLYILKNDCALHYCENLPIMVTNRLVNTFKNEMNKRSTTLKSFFKEKMIENLSTTEEINIQFVPNDIKRLEFVPVL